MTPWVDGLTIGHVLRETAQRHALGEAFVFCNPRRRLTWAQFDADVDRVGRALLALGFEPGDHFGVWATNVPEWVLLQFATARIGVVLVNINPGYRTGELTHALRQSDVRGLAVVDVFKSSNFFEMLYELCPELGTTAPGELQSNTFPRLKWLVALRGVAPPGILSWENLLSHDEPRRQPQLTEIETRLNPHDPINIQFTSGTTGSPKGAMLSHRNVLLNAYYAGNNQQLSHTDRICLPVPLYHCFGCVLGTMVCAVHGSTMVFPSESFQPNATLGAIEQERCTAIYGVPAMFMAMLEHDEYPCHDLSSLRTGIMAGAPCPIAVMKRVTQEMGARQITIGYGQTEASPLITQTRADDPIDLRVGTVGQPISGVAAKIVDAQTGAELEDGEQGEICTRGHNVMVGYYNMPDKTSGVIDPAGWLHTGDLGVREPNGYFRVTGRLRDIIIRGGENISPREVEELLYQHAAVMEVQVVGVPDRRMGEEVLAWVKLKSGCRTTEDELREFCRQSLAHYKAPRYWKFVDSFPTTVTGKVQKYKIRQLAIEELGLQDAASIEMA